MAIWRSPLGNFRYNLIVLFTHSNDSHQCPILAADLLWDRKWRAYLYPSLTSRPCLDGFFIFCPIIKNNKVSCEYGTLMWIIAHYYAPEVFRTGRIWEGALHQKRWAFIQGICSSFWASIFTERALIKKCEHSINLNYFVCKQTIPTRSQRKKKWIKFGI